MTTATLPLPYDPVQALIEQARRRARRRRQRCVAVGLAIAAGAGAYLAFGRSGGGFTGQAATRSSHGRVAQVVHPATTNGPLTVIGGNGISTITSVRRLRTLFRCSVDAEMPCYELQSIAWSPDGRRLAFGATSVANSSAYNGLHVIELASGKDHLLSDAPGDGWSDIAWSPAGFDGFELAYVSGPMIYIGGMDGRGFTALRTGTKGYDSSPSWSPDGTQIAFASMSGRTSAIYTIGLDGSHRRQLARHAWAPAWSPDGSTIAYRVGYGIRLMTPSGRDVTPPSAVRRAHIGLTGDPVWSPDGKKIAFGHETPFGHTTRDVVFAQSGTYVMSADGSDLARVSGETGRGVFRLGRPAWRPLRAARRLPLRAMRRIGR